MQTKIRKEQIKEISVISPSLLNGFSQASGWSTIGYYKDISKVVHLNGLLTGGAANTNVFILPSGYKPASNRIFIVMSSSGLCRCNISSSGEVQFSDGFSSGWTCLDGVTFLAEN